MTAETTTSPNVRILPKEPDPVTESPWPIVSAEARAAWNALQRELATGYVDDSALLGRWYVDAWQRTFQCPVPEWVTRTVPVIAPPEPDSAEPAPVAAAPEPEPEPQPDGPEPAPDATQVIDVGEAEATVVPPVQDGDETNG